MNCPSGPAFAWTTPSMRCTVAVASARVRLSSAVTAGRSAETASTAALIRSAEARRSSAAGATSALMTRSAPDFRR